MFNYELILTDKCTRNCSFCNNKQSQFVASLEQVQAFYNQVIARQKGHPLSVYQISIFGGEPTLNIDALDLTVKLFIDKPCKIVIYTNADLIDQILDKPYISRVVLQISAYDIFSNLEKYLNIINKCKQSLLTYTFTQDDINMIDKYVSICRSNNIKFKLALSHSLRSWDKVSADYIYSVLYDFYKQQFDLWKLNWSIIPPEILVQPFNQIIELIANPKLIAGTCLSSNTDVFYNGKFVGPCHLISSSLSKLSCPPKCKLCIFNNTCKKSCMLERPADSVPDILCSIEKAPLACALDFIYTNINDKQILKSIRYSIDSMWIF